MSFEVHQVKRDNILLFLTLCSIGTKYGELNFPNQPGCWVYGKKDALVMVNLLNTEQSILTPYMEVLVVPPKTVTLTIAGDVVYIGDETRGITLCMGQTKVRERVQELLKTAGPMGSCPIKVQYQHIAIPPPTSGVFARL